MQSTFADLGVSSDITASLRNRGIEIPFAIQSSALPPGLDGRDVCGKAPTGSGKTLAFGIPLATRVGKAKSRRPRALVLAPTRELAAQIERELKPLLALKGRTACSVYGGVGMEPQIRALRKGVDVVVACPGRLKDLVDRKAMVLDDVEIVVIDEADRMADMGFLPEVRRILDQVREDRQTLLFSATLDGDVDVLIRRYQNQPVTCEVAPERDEIDRTEHLFVETSSHLRLEVTADLIREHKSVAVFCRTKHGADRVSRQLAKEGVSSVAIHGDRSQAQRDRALESFRRGRVEALIATDVAARGIHVDDVACVIHFDPPTDSKDYIHRSGRTGRAGAEGVVITLVTEHVTQQVRKLKQDLGYEVGPAAPGTGRKSAGRGQGRGNRSGGARNQGGRPQGGSQGGNRGAAKSGDRSRSAGQPRGQAGTSSRGQGSPSRGQGSPSRGQGSPSRGQGSPSRGQGGPGRRRSRPARAA